MYRKPGDPAAMASTCTRPLDGWTVSPGQYVPGWLLDKPYVYISFELAAQAYDFLHKSNDYKPTAIVKNVSGMFELRMGHVMIPSSCGETTYTHMGVNLAKPVPCPDAQVDGFHKVEGMYMAGKVIDEHGEPVAPCTYTNIKNAAESAMHKAWIGGFIWDGYSKYELRQAGILIPSPAGEVAFVKTSVVLEGYLNWCEQKGYRPRGIKRHQRLIGSREMLDATNSEIESGLCPAPGLESQRLDSTAAFEAPIEGKDGA